VEGLPTHYLRTPGILHLTLGNNHSAQAGFNCMECQLSCWGPLTAGALRPVPHGPHI